MAKILEVDQEGKAQLEGEKDIEKVSNTNRKCQRERKNKLGRVSMAKMHDGSKKGEQTCKKKDKMEKAILRENEKGKSPRPNEYETTTQEDVEIGIEKLQENNNPLIQREKRKWNRK